MKTLYIVRHAKSSWEYAGIEDIDRPLKKRGIKDAHLISKFLSKQIDKPDVFITSSANRALHTALIFCENLVKTVNALDDGFSSAIIFSHDHGINTFVNEFGNKPIAHVPTCGVIALKFQEKHWKNIKKGTTILIESPKNHK
jgi:phosphohistidine phosphatase